MLNGVKFPANSESSFMCVCQFYVTSMNVYVHMGFEIISDKLVSCMYMNICIRQTSTFGHNTIAKLDDTVSLFDISDSQRNPVYQYCQFQDRQQF